MWGGCSNVGWVCYGGWVCCGCGMDVLLKVDVGWGVMVDGYVKVDVGCVC